MLSTDFKISSFFPPAISVFGDKTFVVPGWHEVPKGTTLNEVYEHWTKINYGVEEKNTHKPIKEIVSSSKGDKTYTVIFKNGNWDCDCPGFGFRKKCRHVEEIKTK